MGERFSFPLSLSPFSLLSLCFCHSFENSFFAFIFFFLLVFQNTTSRRYNLRTIRFSHFQCDYRKFTDLCCCPHHLGWGHPPPHRKTRRAHAGSTPVPRPGPQPPLLRLQPTVDVPALDRRRKCHLCFPSGFQHAFEAPPNYGTSKYFIPFYCWEVSVVWTAASFAHPLPS